jgi:hypothetical protein
MGTQMPQMRADAADQKGCFGIWRMRSGCGLLPFLLLTSYFLLSKWEMGTQMPQMRADAADS